MPPGNYPLDTDRILNEPLTEERPAAAPWFAVPWFAVPWFAVPWFAVPWFAVPWFAVP